MTTAMGDRSPEEALASGVVRVRGAGPDGTIGGGGLLVSKDQVLTCAHVVSDALEQPRALDVPAGTEVAVDLPLEGGGRALAVVEHWVPVRDDMTGDVAVLRLRTVLQGSRPLTMAAPDELWGHQVRVPGFPLRFPGGVWHSGTLRGRTAEGWVQLSQADTNGVPVEGGFSGSPVWDEPLRAVVGMVVVAQLGGARQSFLIPTGTLVEEIPALSGVVRAPSPFRGLAAFQESDRHVFFGREQEVANLETLLRGDGPGVTVVGPSGCGKSSLALAGVVPAMRERGYECVVVRPGQGGSPHVALASELARIAHPGLHGAARLAEVAALESSLRERGLADTFRLVSETPPAGLLVVLDQAEELLTSPEVAVREFVELLFPEPCPSGLRVLVTLRADFTDAALSDSWLGPALTRGVVRPLTALARSQMQQVIVKPVETAPGTTYDPGLVQRLLDDTGDEPGALPLLGFVLAQLWEEQAAGRLRFATYEDIGGVRGALGQHAERVWQECVRDGNEAGALRLLTSLVRLLPGGEAPLRNVLTRQEAGEEHWRIAQSLADRRLLVVGRDDAGRQTVELAHEALIGAWPRLAERVRSDRDFLAWRAEVHHDLDQWLQHDRADEQLLGGEPLDVAEEQLRSRPQELSAPERDYIQAGVRRRAEQQELARRRKRQTRWGITGLIGLLASALVVSALYVRRNGELDTQVREAASEQLAARAAQLDDVSLVTSALFSAAAYHTADEPQARTALVEQYLRLAHVDSVVEDNRGPVKSIATSEDGTRLAVLLDQGDLLDVQSGDDHSKPETRTLSTDSSSVVAVSPDGRFTARSTTRGLVDLGVRPAKEGSEWPLRHLRTVDDARKNGRGATALAFDRTGGRLLAAVPREGVTVWETGSGRKVGRTLTAPEGWDVAQAWFGPDADHVVGRVTRRDSGTDGDADGRLVRWDVRDGRRTPGPASTEATGVATVSGDGRVLVRCTPQGVLQAWDLHGDKPVMTSQFGPQQVAQACPLYVPRLDDTGRYLLSPVQYVGPQLRRLQFLVLDLSSGQRSVIELPAPTQQDSTLTGRAQLPAVAFAGTPGHLRAAVSVGGSVVTARIPRPTPFDSAMLTSLIKTANADSGRIASVDPNGEGLRLWDLRTHRQLAGVRPPRPLAGQYAAFSPDGRRLLTTTADGRSVLVWNLPGLTRAGRIDVPLPPDTTPTQPNPLTGLTPSLPSASFSDNDHVVITAASYVLRWNLVKGRREGHMYAPPVQEPVDISAAAADTIGVARPGHAQAAVSVQGNKVLLWDFGKGGEADEIGLATGTVSEMVFDPTGSRLAVLTYDGEVRVWDVDHRRWLPALTRAGVLWLGEFTSPDTLSTQSTTNEYTVWHVDDRTERFHFTVGYGVTGAVSRDGTRMAVVEGSDATLLPLDPRAWRNRVCAVADRGLTVSEKALTPASSRTENVC